MITPRPQLSHIFTPLFMQDETECFFCSELEKDVWMINVNLPNNHTDFFAHVSCFEQLGWSMARYVVDNAGKFGTGGIWYNG